MQNFDNLVVLFQNKRYPIDDYQCEDRAVGIFSGFFVFGENLTIDMPDGEFPNEILNVYDEKGKILGQGQIIKK